MRFTIEAGLAQGVPRLRIFDADSGALRLQWRYPPEPSHSGEHETAGCNQHDCAARAHLHSLMRDLFLLSCASNVGLARAVASDRCIHCDACVPSSSDSVSIARLTLTK